MGMVGKFRSAEDTYSGSADGRRPKLTAGTADGLGQLRLTLAGTLSLEVQKSESRTQPPQSQHSWHGVPQEPRQLGTIHYARWESLE